jgi:hypothetical protein
MIVSVKQKLFSTITGAALVTTYSALVSGTLLSIFLPTHNLDTMRESRTVNSSLSAFHFSPNQARNFIESISLKAFDVNSFTYFGNRQLAKSFMSPATKSTLNKYFWNNPKLIDNNFTPDWIYCKPGQDKTNHMVWVSGTVHGDRITIRFYVVKENSHFKILDVQLEPESKLLLD